MDTKKENFETNKYDNAFLLKKAVRDVENFLRQKLIDQRAI